MGRGRAKAKQTKVARELKYRTYEPDLEQLQRELSGDDEGDDGTGRTDESDAEAGEQSDTDDRLTHGQHGH